MVALPRMSVAVLVACRSMSLFTFLVVSHFSSVLGSLKIILMQSAQVEINTIVAASFCFLAHARYIA